VTAYVALFVAIVLGVVCASLEKAGVGRAETLRNSPGAFVVMLVSIPLNLLTNLGLIAIVVWSFFALRWLPTLGVVLVAFVGFSLLWGAYIARLRRSDSWESLLRIGIPLVFVLKSVAAVCVALLAAVFLKWVRL
jgi:hypothetical protein